MAKFNQKAREQTRIVNRAGGEAFKQDERLELVSLMLTSFVENQYYRSAKGQLRDLERLITNMRDKEFAAKAAVYARNEFGMRSITHAAAAEICNAVKGERWVKDFVANVIRRPDDATEIAAYHMNKHGKRPLPNNMKKGIALALPKFDAYQLSKYKRSRSAVSLVDLVNLTHPEHTEAIGQLVDGTLSPANTWETRMTQAGQEAEDEEGKAEAKARVWSDLVGTRKIGYFALLRNLRNIIEQAPEVVPQAIEMLTDERLIRKSLVLPFRYVTAMDAIASISGPEARQVIGALNVALEVSVGNVPDLDGSTLVIVDVSGSMRGHIRMASIFAAVLYRSNNADLMRFANNARYMTLNPADTVMTLAQQIGGPSDVGGGTDFKAPFRIVNRSYDRFIYVTDMQGWVGYSAPTKHLAQYESMYGRPHIYNIDMTGYGDAQFPEDRVYSLAGFSEKVFDIMELLETDRRALVNTIDAVDLRYFSR